MLTYFKGMYDEVEELSKKRVEACMRSNSTLVRFLCFERAVFQLTRGWQAQANILSLLTRMRQMVLHTGLVPASYIEELKAGEEGLENNAHAKAMALTPADKARLQDKLAQAVEECEECPICFGLLEEPRITSCSHIFCLPWYLIYFFSPTRCSRPHLSITEIISRDPKCPLVCSSFVPSFVLAYFIPGSPRALDGRLARSLAADGRNASAIQRGRRIG